MNLVRQGENNVYCQQACIAMLSDKTLEEVITLVGDKRLGEIERRHAFERFGIEAERWEYIIESFGENSLGAISKKHETLWLRMSDYLDVNFGHAAILHRGQLFDPCDGIDPALRWSRYIASARPVKVLKSQ